MQLFYKILIVVVIVAAAVTAYDLRQAQRSDAAALPRIRFDSASGQFTFRQPNISIRVVYASFMGPGEPGMRITDKWLSMFEEEYSDRLAPPDKSTLTPADKQAFVAKMLDRTGKFLPDARKRLDALQAATDQATQSRLLTDLADWLIQHEVYLTPLDARATLAQKAAAYAQLVQGLESLTADPLAAVAKVQVRPRLVEAERRWQGRWVLSSNRPRFLTGNDVPDVILSDKLEMLALVQDGYAVPMDQPLPGQTVSPLDSPDTWGKTNRPWRDAFLPALLEQGKYSFADNPALRKQTYLVPTACSAFCIFYNKVLFDKAGITQPPRTWPEFIATCEKLKAAGINPITADQAVYGDYWMTWLLFRIMGPAAWQQTVLGTPADLPVNQRKSLPAWTDDSYKAAFGQIRQMREKGFFDKDFRGSTWPAAQRSFAAGNAGMMICGSWLVSELQGYQDAGRQKFNLACFSFPQWPGGREIDQRATWGQAIGMLVCRQGKATPHAVEMVKYLVNREWPDQVYQSSTISCAADADFPPALQGIAEDFRSAPVLYNNEPSVYARRFCAAKIRPLFDALLLKEKGESGYLTVDEFLRTLAKENAAYLQAGGEEGYE